MLPASEGKLAGEIKPAGERKLTGNLFTTYRSPLSRPKLDRVAETLVGVIPYI